MKRLLPGLAVLAIIAACAIRTTAQEASTAPAAPAAAELAVQIDWTQRAEPINRALFSTQGFMQIYVQPNPLVLETFKLTNPQGTQTRLETYIHQMEPENDNDDPSTFNWDKLRPQQMIRFIDDLDAFDAVVEDLGMERLSLLCYNVDWLRSDDPDDPISSHEEWAEFAAAVVETYNKRGEEYEPRLQVVQIWNEPNFEHFYGGTVEAYSALFNTTAQRLHANYPGVQVGGPSTSNAWHTYPNEWMARWLELSGEHADYISFHHYGPMGEPVTALTDRIVKHVNEFRAIPGKEHGRVNITETDAWFIEFPKIQFLLERQFRFLDLQDYIMAVHHFCCLAYNESGNYTFGLVDRQGGVVEGNFWPYWLFRNLIGDKATLTRSDSDAPLVFDAIASVHTQHDSTLHNVVLHNREPRAVATTVTLKFAAHDADRVLALDRLRDKEYGTASVVRIPAGTTSHKLALEMQPGDAVALNLMHAGERHFHFRDINNQERPWIGLTADAPTATLGDRLTLTARVLNTTFEPLAGSLRLGGVPAGWSVTVAEGPTDLTGLAFGEERHVTWTVEARTLPIDDAVGIFAYVDRDGADPLADVDALAHSIPVSFRIIRPLEITVLPKPLNIVPGDEGVVIVQLVNRSDDDIMATVQVGEYHTLTASVPAKDWVRLSPVLPADAFVEPGQYTVPVTVAFLGTEIEKSASIVVYEGERATNAVPLDLGPYLNFDAMAFRHNLRDYDRESMGAFSYPADFTPGDVTLPVRGIPLRFASVADGEKNVVLPQGQRLNIEPTHTSGVTFVGFGHDGKHPGTWRFHYEDGTSDAVESQIPEWCTPPPEGFAVAFTAPHRYTDAGPADPACELFVWTLETDPAKKLRSIELPTFERGAYVYSVTVLPAD